MTQKERIEKNTAAIIHNLMNHGYSEDHARTLMGMMADLLLDLPQEILEDLRKAHEERMKTCDNDIFRKLGEDVKNAAVNNEAVGN